MSSSIIVALLSILGAAITFGATKWYEQREAWKQEKLNHYKLLVSALSDLAVDGIDKTQANEQFCSAVNTIALVANQKVIHALMEFHHYVAFSNPNQTAEGHDELLRKLMLAIRKDVGLASRDDPASFAFHLIGSRRSKTECKTER